MQDDLAEDGIESREVTIDAPEGFRAKRVKALLIEPKRGETSEDTLQRVKRSLERQGVDQRRMDGATSKLQFGR